MNILVCHTIGLIAGYVLDLIIGDPHEMPHLIRLIGSFIAFIENKIYKDKKSNGLVLVLTVICSVMAVTSIVAAICFKISFVIYIIFDAVITFYCLATKSLVNESKNVADDLVNDSIDKARKSLSMIVGRDTESLDEKAVLKATVETIAENASDGVIAPMLYLCIGGPVIGTVYKAVNTMDSMVGYKNERYCNFGFFAAKFDDIMNFIPSRIAAVISILASLLCRFDALSAFKIWRRDRLNHKSPNSAQTEAVYAGALNLKLAGGAYYFGKWVEKPFIGDEIRQIEIADVYRAHKILYVSSIISLFMCVILLMITYVIFYM